MMNANIEEEDHNQANNVKESAKSLSPKEESSNNNTTIGRTKESSIDNDQENDRAFKEKLVNLLKDNELKLSQKQASEVHNSSNFLIIISDQNVDITGHGPLGDKANT